MMLKQTLMCAVLAVPGMLFVNTVTGPVISAAEKDQMHDGLVVSVAEGKLVMTDNDGKNEHTHTIATTTKITLDGKAAKLSELKKGDSVKVTTSSAGAVTTVDAKRPAK
jgi:co-chaperonin GroES (HSP10)